MRWQFTIALAAMLVVGLALGSYALRASATARTLERRVYVEGVVGQVRQLNPLAHTPAASPAEREIASLLSMALNARKRRRKLCRSERCMHRCFADSWPANAGRGGAPQHLRRISKPLGRAGAQLAVVPKRDAV